MAGRDTHITTDNEKEVSMAKPAFKMSASDEKTTEGGSLSEKLTNIISEVSGLRGTALEKVTALEGQLAEARKELAMIDKLIGFQAGAPEEEAQSMPSTRTRLPNGHWKDKIFSLLRGHEDGLTRSDIMEKLDIVKDAKATSAVSNTLTALKKANQIRHENGIYTTIKSAE